MINQNYSLHTAIILTCLLLGIGTISAQEKEAFPKPENNRIESISQDFQKSSTLPSPYRIRQAKGIHLEPTVTESRLIAVTLSQYSGNRYVPTDSVRFHFSGSYELNEYTPYILIGTEFYRDLNLYTPTSSFVYNSIDSMYYFHRSEGEEYGIVDRSIATLDEEGRLLTLHVINHILGKWVNDKKIIYTYDAQSQLTTELTKDWSGFKYYNTEKTDYTYDAQGNILEILDQHWNYYKGKWLNEERRSYTYNPSGNLVEYVQQYWDGSASKWLNSSRFRYTYDNNIRSSRIEEDWDDQSFQWDFYEKIEYGYNNKGQRNETIFLIEYGDSLNPKLRISYEYNAAGNLLTWKSQEWNWNEDSLKYKRKETYTYDGALLKERTFYKWNNKNQQLIKDSHYVFTRNNYGQCTIAEMEKWDGNKWISQPEAFKYNFYYEEYSPTSTQEVLSKADFTVYPNPATQQITLSIKEMTINQVRITNIAGQTVYSNKTPLNAVEVTIPVGQLSPWVYFVQVTSETAIASKKIVVE